MGSFPSALGALNQAPLYSDLILTEAEMQYSRVAGVVASGQGKLGRGTVLGALALAAAAVAPAGTGTAGANTGNGVLTMDTTTPLLANVQQGVYVAKCTVAGTNAATFRVTDPTGDVLGDTAFSGTGTSAAFADQLKFTITDGTTDFVVGDAFAITIGAGTGKYVVLAPAAQDGSQIAAGVLVDPVDATSADAPALLIVRHAILKSSGLIWPGSISTPQKATALAQLASVGGIVVRQAV